jgi:hypothetical protein
LSLSCALVTEADVQTDIQLSMDWSGILLFLLLLRTDTINDFVFRLLYFSLRLCSYFPTVLLSQYSLSDFLTCRNTVAFRVLTIPRLRSDTLSFYLLPMYRSAPSRSVSRMLLSVSHGLVE